MTGSSSRFARPISHPPPAELRDALRTIDTHVENYIDRARLGKAA